MARSIFGLLFLFSLLGNKTFAQISDFKILKSDANGLTLVFTPQYQDTSFLSVDQNQYRNASFYFGKELSAIVPGDPQINNRVFAVGVPSEINNSVRIFSYKSKFINGVLVPVPTEINKSTNKPKYLEGEKYRASASFPSQMVTLGNYGFVRGLSIGELAINPVVYHPNRKQIELITSIQVEIVFGQQGITNNSVNENYYHSLVINGSQAKKWVDDGNGLAKNQNASNVSFAQGKWYRFEANDEGIYKIGRDALPSLGIDPNTCDPRKIRIYGYGGFPLSEKVDPAAVQNLQELAIFVEGQDDGVFNNDDYILFYGRGINFWYFDSVRNYVVRNRNPYSFKNYYYIHLSDQTGKRMGVKKSLKTSSPVVQSSTNAYLYKEEDKVNLGKTGLEFYGQEMNSRLSTMTENLTLDGYQSGSQVNVTYRIIGVNHSETYGTVDALVNKTAYTRNYLAPISDVYTVGTDMASNFSVTSLPTGSNVMELQFSLSVPGASDLAYLDYYHVTYTKDLKANGDVKFIFNKSINTTIEYQLSGFSNSNNRVFDITKHADVQIIDEPVKQSGADYWFQVAEGTKLSSKYIALNNSQFKTISGIAAVSNQNLRGISTGAKYVVITPKVFAEQARKLADFRSNSAVEKLSSLVVDVDEIYVEFGYGTKDPTAIRDFLTYAYANWSVKPEYVVLFGDGDYDYRNIEGMGNNFIPTHQIEYSLNQVDSYGYDDYFSCIVGNDRYADVAVGRITAQTVSHAKIYVDKVIAYETNTDKSSWRNLVGLVADDDLKPTYYEGFIHVEYSEDLSALMPGSFVNNKLYANLFQEELTSLGRRRPTANKAIIGAINNGMVILNYYGHGSPDVWADEQIFTNNSTIPALTNKNPFFLSAATCDFGYFDQTSGLSGTEQLIFKDGGGAIGAFATNRPVYASPNKAINERFYATLFTADTNDSRPVTPIGKVYMMTKVQSTAVNDLKFHLFGDPALRLLIPLASGTVENINGNSLNNVYQLKGLSKAVIDGKVLKFSGETNTSFNGEALLSVYDSKRSTVIGEYAGRTTIEIPGGLLFRGRVKITNGTYSTMFVVPKDISSENKLGKITLYFFNDEVGGTAYTNNIRVGGFDTTANDLKGPEITIAFDSKEVNDNFVVLPNSKMYVQLKDATAINTANTGIGHELSAVFNDNEATKIDLSPYYIADINSNGTSGIVEYPFNDLPAGDYTVKISAFDVFNNLDSASTQFKVVSSSELQLVQIYNYPNPFNSTTSFLIDHNYAASVKIDVKVYSIAGRLLQELTQSVNGDRHVVIPWDGKDKEGTPLANGVYLYKVKMVPSDGAKTVTYTGKLAITR